MSNYAFIPKKDACVKKLGSMSYTWAPSVNCDDDCPFKGDGCYAENYHAAMAWGKHQRGESHASCTYEQMLGSIRNLPRGDKLRFWIGGDFPKNGTGSVDCIKATQIAKASIGKKTIVFTHHQPWSGNGAWGATIRNLKPIGFQVNVSCESERQVDDYMADGIDCVLTVPSTETRKQWRTAGGNRVRLCPNQVTDGAVTCEQCMLCSSRPDDMVIAFKGHGTRVKKFNQVLTSANQ